MRNVTVIIDNLGFSLDFTKLNIQDFKSNNSILIDHHSIDFNLEAIETWKLSNTPYQYCMVGVNEKGDNDVVRFDPDNCDHVINLLHQFKDLISEVKEQMLNQFSLN